MRARTIYTWSCNWCLGESFLTVLLRKGSTPRRMPAPWSGRSWTLSTTCTEWALSTGTSSLRTCFTTARMKSQKSWSVILDCLRWRVKEMWCPQPAELLAMLLLKCWPRNPTAKPWTAGPSGSSHISCSVGILLSMMRMTPNSSSRSSRQSMSSTLHTGMISLSLLKTSFGIWWRRTLIKDTPVSKQHGILGLQVIRHSTRTSTSLSVLRSGRTLRKANGDKHLTPQRSCGTCGGYTSAAAWTAQVPVSQAHSASPHHCPMQPPGKIVCLHPLSVVLFHLLLQAFRQ